MKEKDSADLSRFSIDPKDYGGTADADVVDSEPKEHGDPGLSNPGLSDLSAEEIVADIQRNISCIAYCHARVIALIDEADRRGLWAQWIGVKSLPQWVMHIASVSMHTAREYVRVMTALREMPQVKDSLAEGNVSFSKVREVTRLAGRIGDKEALRLASVATGSQISRISRNCQQLSTVVETGDLPRFLPTDSVSMRATEPGRTKITIDLEEDDAAEIFTMLDAARHVLEQEAARDRLGNEEAGDCGEEALPLPSSTADKAVPADGYWETNEEKQKARAEGTAPRAEAVVVDEKPSPEPISQVMCLMEIFHAFPRADSVGTVDPDRARMLVHASAEVVTRTGAALEVADHDASTAAGIDVPLEGAPEETDPFESVPAGTRTAEAHAVEAHAAEVHGVEEAPADDETPADNSATASAKEDATCRVDGFGGITSATAQRLSCEALISGAIKDADGDVLMLGRSKRLVSKRQRLALSARDIGCQFPGCLARRRCDAHHIRPWSQGGPTDLDNLVLLCRAHHTVVHKYQLRIERTGASFAGALQGPAAFGFFLPDGAELLPLEKERRGRQVFDTACLVAVAEEATAGADPSTVGGGYGFDVDYCIAWMFEAEWRHARENDVAA